MGWVVPMGSMSGEPDGDGSRLGGKGKPPVEPVSLARRSKRLESIYGQYVVAEAFPSISDTEDDDGVEF